jgi:hypothetical protein
MRVPEKYYDEIYFFKGQWDLPSCCGLRILRQEKTFVIVTELYQENPGTSVTAAGKSLLQQICHDKSLNLDEITYIQCNPGTGSKLSFYDEEFFEADFSGGGEPAYRQLSKREIQDYFRIG